MRLSTENLAGLTTPRVTLATGESPSVLTPLSESSEGQRVASSDGLNGLLFCLLRRLVKRFIVSVVYCSVSPDIASLPLATAGS